jgi:hypothetical protein
MTGAALALTLAACTYDFEAASKRYAADPSTGGAPVSSSSTGAGATVGAGGTAGAGGDGAHDACHPAGDPQPFNLPGEVGATRPYTYWYWPSIELTSLEWALNVDFDPPNDGYFWSHHFGFSETTSTTLAGFVGIQQHGTFTADPPDGNTEIIKMALFSIEGALDAEAGLPSPDGTVHPTFDGAPGFSVHIRYSWVPCRTYVFRMFHIEDEPDGNRWYGALIRDTATGDETMIGRILVPAELGPLGASSIFASQRFGFNQLVACEVQEHASAVFEHPTGNGGMVKPDNKANKFEDPPHCPNARFTELPGAIRQEMGVPRGQ